MEATTGLIDQWAFNTCVCLHVYFNTHNSQYSVIQETNLYTQVCVLLVPITYRYTLLEKHGYKTERKNNNKKIYKTNKHKTSSMDYILNSCTLSPARVTCSKTRALERSLQLIVLYSLCNLSLEHTSSANRRYWCIIDFFKKLIATKRNFICNLSLHCI